MRPAIAVVCLAFVQTVLVPQIKVNMVFVARRRRNVCAFSGALWSLHMDTDGSNPHTNKGMQHKCFTHTHTDKHTDVSIHTWVNTVI